MLKIYLLKVYFQAQRIGITQPCLDAKYVKRSKLKEYLPAKILKPEQKTSSKV